MKGGSPTVDTSGQERATREAIELQRDIYEQNKELAQPFYDVGVSSLGRLSDLLGINGGSVGSRESIYNDLLPQYTTPSAGSGLASIGGYTVNVDDLLNKDLTVRDIFGVDGPGEDFSNARWRFLDAYDETGDISSALEQSKAGSLLSPPQTTDFVALNAAVDAALEDQDLPDDFGSLTERFDLAKFEEDPGYQYRLDEGRKALERAMSAQGVTLGGGGFGTVNPQVAKALQEQAQGLASQEYGSAYNRYVQDQMNQYNMLAGLAGYGTAGLGSVTGAGSEYAANVGNLTTGLAQSQTQADLAAASQPSMFEQLLPVAGQVASAYLLKSDIRVKENIEIVGKENGHNIYEFNYKGDDKRYVGVLAQEVQNIVPDAVVEVDGVLKVDYGMIGVEMRMA